MNRPQTFALWIIAVALAVLAGTSVIDTLDEDSPTDAVTVTDVLQEIDGTLKGICTNAVFANPDIWPPGRETGGLIGCGVSVTPRDRTSDDS